MEATEKRVESCRPVCEKKSLMQTAYKSTYKSIRLFKSPFFEWFSHIHPATPLIVWGPVAAWFIWRSYAVFSLSPLEIAAMGAFALIAWSLAEYTLHRFVFHFEPKGALQEKLHFIMHGIHHADPVDPTRLVMPPPVALILALLLFPLFRFALGPVWVNPFFGFFIVGYLAYDYTHYAVHHFTPRTRWGKALKQNHMIHHYVNPELRWGVSSPVWDVVFGTFEEPKPVKKPARAQKARPSDPAGKPGLSAKGIKTRAAGAKLNQA